MSRRTAKQRSAAAGVKRAIFFKGAGSFVGVVFALSVVERLNEADKIGKFRRFQRLHS